MVEMARLKFAASNPNYSDSFYFTGTITLVT